MQYRDVNSRGLGFSASQADADLVCLTGLFSLLPELPATYTEWRKLVVAHGVLGKSGHDVHLVAAMLAHAVTHLLTFNAADFARFSTITVLTPPAVLAPPPTPPTP